MGIEVRVTRSVLKLKTNVNYKEITMNDNTKLFIDTIDNLASSQGFYSRMSRDIHEAINNNPSIIAKLDRDLPKFNSPVGVVMYIEG